ncbi:hypothetical protein EOA85_20490 [Mesorhizobium sp. M5C.F.Ca.IN.020.29.1.1]|uniref:phosphoribosyltransferase-like protein n=1 Tax=unclassified Mesorhizobium TaxID=325217 RepID=UPI000FC9B4E2|nr:MULTISPECIES: hypothetical protein [unclassified Mesorhizobium]RUV55771.1 hypothetical protein EOA85_20490 [Mesorhizobium sp. M5C.F.Ca.IN.020.29.1.1]TIM87315.1 MAG: hypothetical protein E5Y50_12645 [Mesorhizobium sp.]
MNEDLGLRVLGEIMLWSDDEARKEFDWLRLMARLKYDGYRDFQAGMRFIESLATWLQQFKTPNERNSAYGFVRNALVYVGPSEMQRLVEQLYPKIVRDRLVRMVAAERGIPPYRVYADVEARKSVERLRRQTLFMGLSDGARIDGLRHSNAGLLTNEQLVVSTQLDTEKWQDLLENLEDELEEKDAKFKLVYLIDDFMGTGTSFLRYNEKKEKWSGKLTKFKESIELARKNLDGKQIFADNWYLCIHHYIGTNAAASIMVERESQARSALQSEGWASDVHFSFGTVLPAELPIDAPGNDFGDFIELTKAYYDPSIRTKHTDVGGVTHLGLGYGGCALPVILDHNTPNNSVALLWAETDGGKREGGVDAPPMSPLFRRRQRHV